MGAMTLDTIMIKIESDASKATGNIDKLSTSLQNLRSSIKGGFNNLNKLSEALDKLGKASSKIPKLKENLDGISEISSSLNKLSSIGNPTGLKSAVDSLSKLPGVMSKITPKHLENVSRVSNELASALTPLSDKLAQIGQGFSAISQLADKYGVSVTKVHDYTKQARSTMTKLGGALNVVGKAFKGLSGVSQTFGKTAVKQFTKLHSKIKQVGLSLLGTRTLFTAVRKAVSEYMALDQELASNIQNVWRALGAQLAPAIEYVIYLFKQFVRVVYSFVKAITGIDLIARANAKAMSGWGKSAKDTLGQLQKFDDLNVAEFDKGAGDDAFIDLTEIDLSPIQWIIDATLKIKQALKDAFETGEWYGVGTALADGINQGLEKIDVTGIRDKLLNISTQFGKTLNGVIDTLNWSKLSSNLSGLVVTVHDTISTMFDTINWTSLGAGVNDFIKNLDLSGMLVSFANIYTTIVDGLRDALGQIEWGIVGQKISDTVVGLSSLIANELANTDFTAIGEALRTVIINIDWKGIWDNVVTIAKESFSGLADFIDGLFGVEGIGDLAVAIGGVVVALDALKKLGTVFTPLIVGATKLKAAITGLPKIFQTISLLSKNTLTAESISGITGASAGLTKALAPIGSLISSISTAVGGSLLPIIGIIAAIVVGVIALVEAFKNLWQNSESFRTTVLELVDGIKGTALKIFEQLKVALGKIIDVVKDLWQKTIKPLFDFIVVIVEPILDALMSILNILWKDIIEPIANFLLTIFSVAIDYVVGRFKLLIGILEPVIKILQWLYEVILEPIVVFLLDVLIVAIKVVAVVVREVVNSITSFIEGLWNFIKKIINWVLAGIEGLINAIISGINWLTKQLNKISFDVPDWVPAIGGKKLGFDIKSISEVTLPRLETGTNNVPYEGIYHLHPGEAVVPKKYNPALGNGGSEETNQKLDTLIYLMENMNFTNIVNVGNATLYKGQQAYNKMQNDIYGTTVNI